VNYVVYTEVVEFQQSSDRRTGKPIAIAVNRAPLKTSCEIISEKPATGIVLAEAKAIKNKGVCMIQYIHSFPCVLESPGFFSLDFAGPGKSWKISLVHESPGN